MDTKEIEKRVAAARELHNRGMNCCQSVVMAYADMLPVDNDTAMKMCAPFGRGISGLRETCGCVTGMALVLLQMQGKDHSCNDLVACAARLLGETL